MGHPPKKARSNQKAAKCAAQPTASAAEKLKAGIEACHANDGTWELLDCGEITPFKLAIALVLWPAKEDVRDLADDPDNAKRAIGIDLWSAVQALNRENLVEEIEDSAERFETNPAQVDLKTTVWTHIAALQVLGHETRRQVPREATGYIAARELVRSRRSRFEA